MTAYEWLEIIFPSHKFVSCIISNDVRTCAGLKLNFGFHVKKKQYLSKETTTSSVFQVVAFCHFLLPTIFSQHNYYPADIPFSSVSIAVVELVNLAALK